MARKQGALAAIPKSKRVIEAGAARLAIAKHLMSLTSLQNVNMVQARSQVHEEEAVTTLVDFMRDAELPQPFRRECALDIIKFARGGVRLWQHSGETIIPQSQGESGNTVGAELAAARNTTALYEKFDKLVAAGVHPDDWPQDVRQIAGELIDHYSQVGTIIEG